MSAPQSSSTALLEHIIGVITQQNLTLFSHLHSTAHISANTLSFIMKTSTPNTPQAYNLIQTWPNATNSSWI